MMKKKIVSIILTAIMVLSLLPVTAFAADPHTHGEGTDAIEFQPWTSADSLPNTAGNWYLTKDVEISETWTATAGTSTEAAVTNLCLKGHVIKMTGSGSVIEVPQYATLNLYDCDTTKHYFTKDATSGLWTLAADQTTPTDYAVTGGVITGGTGKVRDTDRSDGGGLYVSGTVNMYGGNVTGNKPKNNGGGVYLNTNAILNMYGNSTISGNTSYQGVGVYSKGALNMYGNSQITQNKGTVVGGILVDAGLLNMTDESSVSYNEANIFGGGVQVTNDAAFNMSGNSKVSNNKGQKGGGVYVVKGTFTMESGTIDHNTATDNGGGVYIGKGLFNMTGGSITENTAGTNGGGVHLDSDFGGPATLGGTANITGNTAGASTSKKASDVNVNTKELLTIGTGALAPKEGMSIGVILGGEDDPKERKITTNGTAGDVNYFFADDADYVVVFNTGNYLEIKKAKTITNGTAQDKEGTNHGYITIDKTKALKGDTVTVTVVPSDGYVLDAVPSYVLSGTTYKGTKSTEDNQYTFEMPDSDITITASFKLHDHVDTNKDHKCDICEKVISNHVDDDKDHLCDVCGKAISNHEDTDKNHVCDYCGKVISNHVDDDKDHLCDVCGKAISNHEDTDKNHVCDYCGKVISNHEDDDPKDHICDYCGKVISNHIDEDKDHVCDICKKAISNHGGVFQKGLKPTYEAPGYKDYYQCELCGKFFEDENCKVEIKDLDAWKAEGGNGYLPKLTTPVTGDRGNAVLWGAVLAVSFAALIASIIAIVKRKKA